MFSKLFNNEYEEVDRSIERKLRDLGLQNDIEMLKAIPCVIIHEEEHDIYEIREISLSDVVGFNRFEMRSEKNWFEGLESLTKMYIFDRFKGIENFERVLNDVNILSQTGAPQVTEYQGKYYISGEGKHRLTYF